MPYREQFREVLESVRDGRVDPGRAAAAVGRWSPEACPRLLDHLAAEGAVVGDRPEPVPATARVDAAGDLTLEWQHDAGDLDDEDEATPAAAAGYGPACRGPRYRPVRLHRSGGLGQVWIAYDSVLGREVALKIIKPDQVVYPDLAERFGREARVTAVLEHPGIVPLYDYVEAGESWHRGPAYVMRFVRGGTLADAVAAYHAARANGAATRLAFRELLDALVAVCRAVAYAHDRGALHRDLKGQNVVLGKFGEVFLLDWGLTKLSLRSSDPRLLAALLAADETADGVVSGTPAYMAPEVAAGGEATKASDVYGLGAILYAVLTGKAPAEGTPQDILVKLASEDPPPPRHANPAASAALEAVCRKAMSRDPAARYQGAEELATDLRRWLADEPVGAYREPWADRAARWARRHRSGVGAAAAGLLTAALALAVSTGLLAAEERKTRAEAAAAAEQRDRAEANLDAAYTFASEIERVTEKVLPPVDGSETSRRHLATLSAAAFRAFAAQRPESPDLARTAARLTRVEANLHRLTGDHAAAERAYRQALAADAAAGDQADPYARPETLRDYANLQEMTGRPLTALGTLDVAQVLIDAARTVDGQSAVLRRLEARTFRQRCACEVAVGRYQLAAASGDRAVQLFGELLDLPPAKQYVYDRLQMASAHGHRAMALIRLGRLPDATAETSAAKKLLKRYLTPEPGDAVPPSMDGVLSTQAFIVLVDTRIARAAGSDPKGIAERNLVRIAERYKDLHARHPHIPHYRGMLGRALVAHGGVVEAAGNSAGAAADYETAAGHLKVLVRDYPAFPQFRFDLGLARLGLSRTAGDSAARSRDAGMADLRAAAAASPDEVEFRDALAAAAK